MSAASACRRCRQPPRFQLDPYESITAILQPIFRHYNRNQQKKKLQSYNSVQLVKTGGNLRACNLRAIHTPRLPVHTPAHTPALMPEPSIHTIEQVTDAQKVRGTVPRRARYAMLALLSLVCLASAASQVYMAPDRNSLRVYAAHVALSLLVGGPALYSSLRRTHAVTGPYLPLLTGAYCVCSLVLAAMLAAWLRWLDLPLARAAAMCIATYFHTALFVQIKQVMSAGLRGDAYLYCISWPASAAFSACLLAALVAPVLPLLSAPVAVCLASAAQLLAVFGLVQTVRGSAWEEVLVVLPPPAAGACGETRAHRARGAERARRLPLYVGPTGADGQSASASRVPVAAIPGVARVSGDEVLTRAAALSADAASQPELRIIQITDPHIGPFVPIERLRQFCAEAVALDPDLVLLTGDYLTSESHASPRCLEDALAPLAALRGRVFAALGNHDHEAEALPLVKSALAAHGIELLVNAERIVTTRAGRVQLVGVDFFFLEPERFYSKILANHPRAPGVEYRLILMHDPSAFRYVSSEDDALVLSGHTHGGQLGLLSCGCEPTVVSCVMGARMPDHGLWARGRARLYVHRGQGMRSLGGHFLLRVGVPAEQSVMRIGRAGVRHSSTSASVGRVEYVHEKLS